VVDQDRIREFLTEFQSSCDPNEFWYMMDNGGDGHFRSLIELKEGAWLFNALTEMSNFTLLLYRDDSVYKNFFIILFGPDAPFFFSNRQGGLVERKSITGWEKDEATLVDEIFYVDPEEVRNGYYRDGRETIPVEPERFKTRIRHLTESAVMIVPNGTATAVMASRDPSVDLIQSALKNRNLAEADLKAYLRATRGHLSQEIREFM
jgi:eukaryotic-like serine/threonine-protein kinase